MDAGKHPRRDFFKWIATGFAALAFGKPGKLFSSDPSQKPSYKMPKTSGDEKYSGLVVIAQNKDFTRRASGTKKEKACSEMLDRAVVALTGEKNPEYAWRRLFPIAGTVGIKLNCMAAPNLSPAKELVAALVAGLSRAGLKKNEIIIWERTERELKRAGFEISRSSDRVRCLATDSEGVGFEDEIENSGSVGSLFSKIISRMSDMIINVGVLKDHDLAGVCAGMKNFYGSIHNPNKYHDNNCNPFVADLCNHRFIRDKLKLTVIDASSCQYHGGPAFQPDFLSELNSVIVGKDMVSIDRVSHDMIERERKKRGLKSLAEEKRYPSYIDTAVRLGLGEGDRSKIRIVNI